MRKQPNLFIFSGREKFLLFAEFYVASPATTVPSLATTVPSPAT
jgi:hypothetical protein